MRIMKFSLRQRATEFTTTRKTFARYTMLPTASTVTTIASRTSNHRIGSD